jgi:hypothetical protein
MANTGANTSPYQNVREALFASRWHPGVGLPACQRDGHSRPALRQPPYEQYLRLQLRPGHRLSSSAAGTPHKVHLLDADFDNCVTGIHVDAPGQSGYAATMQMANVTVQSRTGGDVPKGNGISIEATAAFAMVQAFNLRVAHSGLNAIRIDAANATFYGENVSLESWHGDCGFFIGSRSSFAYMGVGFGYTAGGTPYAPKSPVSHSPPGLKPPRC